MSNMGRGKIDSKEIFKALEVVVGESIWSDDVVLSSAR